MKVFGTVSLVIGLLWGSFSYAEEAALPQPLQQEAQTALSKGLAWLASRQKEGGYWSTLRFPAMTGLPLWAFAGSGGKQYQKQMDQAVAFILSKAQKDGGIYVPDPRRGGAGLGNYNTSVCMTALHATGRKDVERVIQKAREYTAATQLTGQDEHTGGFGYDHAGKRYSDLTNTGMALDAMRRTQSVEDSRPAGEKRVDLNWDSALAYVSRMQLKEGKDEGGFVYTLSSSGKKGGAQKKGVEPAARRPLLRSYGSITYIGLLSLIHCRLDRSDPRVRSALDFCSKYWTLDENPGQGGQGVFFYYDIMSRALNSSGLNKIAQKKGADIPWREEVVKKLISLQKPEGYWVNDHGRWMENDPILVTSYSLIALEVAMGLAK